MRLQICNWTQLLRRTRRSTFQKKTLQQNICSFSTRTPRTCVVLMQLYLKLINFDHSCSRVCIVTTLNFHASFTWLANFSGTTQLPVTVKPDTFGTGWGTFKCKTRTIYAERRTTADDATNVPLPLAVGRSNRTASESRRVTVALPFSCHHIPPPTKITTLTRPWNLQRSRAPHLQLIDIIYLYHVAAGLQGLRRCFCLEELLGGGNSRELSLFFDASSNFGIDTFFFGEYWLSVTHSSGILQRNTTQSLIAWPIRLVFYTIQLLIARWLWNVTTIFFYEYSHIPRMPPQQQLCLAVRFYPSGQDLALQRHCVAGDVFELTARSRFGHREEAVLETLHDPRINKIKHTC